ncbi:hypothetical protein BsWGS_25071 [Bradybaena similaris]
MQDTNLNFDNLPSSISEFFTPEQFAEISEYEKQLFSNLRQHFEALRRAGLPVDPPEFMLRNRSEKKRRKLVTPSVIESSEGSDFEFTPALEKQKRPSGADLELNYDKLHPDLSLEVSSFTRVHIEHEQHDVNFILNDTDTKPTATAQTESINTCVNTRTSSP